MMLVLYDISPLNTNPIKWSNTLKQFVAKLPTNCLIVFDHFVGLALMELALPIFPIYFNTAEYSAAIAENSALG